MTSIDFIYWLNSFFYLFENNKALSPEQVQIIKNHLKLVFLYEIDPSYYDNKVLQQFFPNIHDDKDPLMGIQDVSFPLHIAYLDMQYYIINFMLWLDGYLDACGDKLNISKTNLIKNKLHRLLEHV